MQSKAPGRSQRFEERFTVTLPVRLTLGRHTVPLETADVSYHGLFLKSASPPSLRELVRLAVDLPSGRTLVLHAMAVHVVPPNDPRGRPAGVGLQFYAVDKDTQGAWTDHVRGIARALAALGPPERRTQPRYAAELELELRSLDELHVLCTRDVSEGGMFIVTDLALPVGEVLRIQILHPENGGRFTLDAQVRRHEKHPARGLGVEFLAMDTTRREAFMEFVRGGFILDEVTFEPFSLELLSA